MWEIACAQCIGGRSEQQDRCAALLTPNAQECLLAVADGMGGHRGGALAAEAVVRTVASFWQATEKPIPAPDRFLAGLCQAAHDAINRMGGEHGLKPGSTAVFLHLGGAQAQWCHVGDSRLYLFRRGRPVRRSRDHSLVQLLVDLGHVTEGDMARHPDQNKLLRSLGGQAGAGAVEPSLDCEPLSGGEAFVLCSDGLWETVTVDEMAAALAEPDLAQAASGLAALAEERGGPRGDNVTVILVRPKSAGGG